MNPGDWFCTAVYALVTLLLGMGFFSLFPKAGFDSKGHWALAYLMGQLLWLSLVLLTGFLPLSLTAVGWMAIAAAGLSAIRLFRQQGPRWPFLQLGGAFLCILLVMSAFPSLWVSVQYEPVVAWDARSIWFFHAKVLYVDDGLNPAFFTNPLYTWWSHMDYPLLMPAQSAAFSLLRGQWSDYGVRAFFLINLAAYVRLAYGILRSQGLHPILSLFIITLIFDKWPSGFVNGYADCHYILCLILVALLALQPSRIHLPTAASLLAYAANMKHEGAMYVMLFLAFTLGITLVRRWYQPPSQRPALFRSGFDWMRSVLSGLLAGGFAWFLWAAFRLQHHIRGDLQLMDTLSNPRMVLDLIMQRLPTIIHFGVEYYRANGCGWVIVAIVLLYCIRRYVKSSSPSVITAGFHGVHWLAFGLINVMIGTVFILTPYNLEWHLGTAGLRLMLLPDLLLRVIALGAFLPLLNFFRTSRGNP